MTAVDARLDLIRHWLGQDLRWPLVRLEPASADASFRRYFRAWRRDGATRIVMDAPPDKEDIRPYLKVSALLEECDVHVPRIDAVAPELGFALLEDLGSTHYLAQLQSGGNASALYDDALGTLARIQVRGRAAALQLPLYDREVLQRELQLMPEWFCGHHLRLPPDDTEQGLIARAFEFLVREALAQPTVFVHRDFHSRNLMVLAERNPGVLDFQDALCGPVGYDLVSLLKDCYIAWPRAQVESWVEAYRLRLQATGGVTAGSALEFLRWFDLIGMQRHIKVLGIFARLWYRDGKSGYLADLPRTLEYLRATASRHQELAPFSAWLERRIVPNLGAANARVLDRSGSDPGVAVVRA